MLTGWDVGGTDLLRDASCLSILHVGAPNVVQNLSLAWEQGTRGVHRVVGRKQGGLKPGTQLTAEETGRQVHSKTLSEQRENAFAASKQPIGTEMKWQPAAATFKGSRAARWRGSHAWCQNNAMEFEFVDPAGRAPVSTWPRMQQMGERRSLGSRAASACSNFASRRSRAAMSRASRSSSLSVLLSSELLYSEESAGGGGKRRRKGHAGEGKAEKVDEMVRKAGTWAGK